MPCVRAVKSLKNINEWKKQNYILLNHGNKKNISNVSFSVVLFFSFSFYLFYLGSRVEDWILVWFVRIWSTEMIPRANLFFLSNSFFLWIKSAFLEYCRSSYKLYNVQKSFDYSIFCYKALKKCLLHPRSREKYSPTARDFLCTFSLLSSPSCILYNRTKHGIFNSHFYFWNFLRKIAISSPFKVI